MDKEERLLSLYARQYHFYRFESMIKTLLMRKSVLKEKIENEGWKELYLYGNDELCELTYEKLSEIIKIGGVIYEGKRERIAIPEKQRIKIESLDDIDKDAIMLIATLRNGNEIRDKLSQFVDRDKIFFINEFLL
ncbi:MAG: hypothetical protein IJ682_04405 [Lachnospiraceae bacterium]|nr:hypothetical protein [Lachnospiraceae bacterium]